MTVNGYDVKKSEFEYFFRKNRTETDVTRKTVRQYADLYLNFKLKVQAAMDEGLDQSDSFLKEYRMYRNMQAEDYLTDNAFLDSIAHEAYKKTVEDVGSDGLAYLRVMSFMPRSESLASYDSCVERMSAVYEKLLNGEDFASLAIEYSDDEETAPVGGDMGWVMRGQFPPEIGNIIFGLEPGRFSEPVNLDELFVIFKVDRRRQIGDFESESAEIYDWMNKRPYFKEEARRRKANEYAVKLGWTERDAEAVARLDSVLEEVEPEFGNISREYHDGLLLFDISNKEVWEKASRDSAGMEKWFNANRKQFAFDKPRFKGLVFFCLDEDVFHNAESALKGVPFENWLDTLFAMNRNQVQVRVMRGPSENGVFKEGDNAYVDHFIFGKEDEVKSIDGFPYVNVLGKLISKPECMKDVSSQVVEGYQDYLEKQWVKKLRKQYKHKIYRKALKQVSLNK
jgi:peptidyl-prolyl cis-trans isomerase SurA